MPQPVSNSPRNRTPSAETVRKRQLWLTGAIIILAGWVALPFLTPIAWAAVLAIAEWPLFELAVDRLGGRRVLAAVLMTLTTALVIILPLSLVATNLAGESQTAIAWVNQVQQSGLAAPPWLVDIPVVGNRMSQWWQANIGSPAGARALLGTVSAGSVVGWARTGAAAVATETGLFLVTLIALVSLLARGHEVADQTRRVSGRMFGRFGEDFVAKLTEAVRRTVGGTLLVSVIEGALIGVGYVVAGVPQPLLFAVATIVLALIPFGAWVAFGLASLILVFQDHLLAGILLFAFGATVMTIGDNAIQPAVIGGSVKLPFLLAFVGAFGGLAAMGLVGLFVGPVIMVAVLLIWREWVPASEAAS